MPNILDDSAAEAKRAGGWLGWVLTLWLVLLLLLALVWTLL